MATSLIVRKMALNGAKKQCLRIVELRRLHSFQQSTLRSLQVYAPLQQQVGQPSSSSSSSSSSPIRRPARERRMRENSNVDAHAVDLVGPPDPVSNIRPMIYADPQTAQRAQSNSEQASTAQPHPYSVNEFSLPSSRQAASHIRRPRGLGYFAAYGLYVDRVCDRLEEAEFKLRLSKLTTDTTTQRFWRDNNSRFTRDLHSWQVQQQKEEKNERATSNSSPSTSMTNVDHVDQAVAGLSSESDFYATWLRANAKRNRAYNILVWQQAFAQVRLGANVVLWRGWLSILRKLEGSNVN